MSTPFFCFDSTTIWIGIQGWKWIGFSLKAPFVRIWFETKEV